ncbi:hypothetical protein BTO16_15925 [Polaribacter glomeratus]|uniref:Uncharacterized protein n=2 Tax=Polaribacter glomeratus TaxID=102 RepID=A0A2S7WIA6_9FLAO|nr:hypothetical protein BTO16_15925 [Polaribacter glomeratus]
MYSCQNNTIVLTERIEMKIDNTIVDFNNNIEAKLILLPASTGSPNYFRLTAEDNSSNTFMITNLFPVLGVTPVVPSSGAIQAPESNFISVFGLDVDDGNAGNNLVYSVTAFGLEGEQIEATISGTYYDNLNVQHTLFIIIDVTRDQ